MFNMFPNVIITCIGSLIAVVFEKDVVNISEHGMPCNYVDYAMNRMSESNVDTQTTYECVYQYLVKGIFTLT